MLAAGRSSSTPKATGPQLPLKPATRTGDLACLPSDPRPEDTDPTRSNGGQNPSDLALRREAIHDAKHTTPAQLCAQERNRHSTQANAAAEDGRVLGKTPRHRRRAAASHAMDRDPHPKQKLLARACLQPKWRRKRSIRETILYDRY